MFELYMMIEILVLLVTDCASRCLAAHMDLLDVALQSVLCEKLFITEAALFCTQMGLLDVALQSVHGGKLLITEAALWDLSVAVLF